MGGTGTASYVNGALSISAAAAGNGVAIADSATTPSKSANGEGFSQYFGLNNLIESSGVTNYQTGLTASDPSGFAAGQTLTLRLSDASGSQITDVTVTTPGGTVQNLINALNAPQSGVGLYGSFSLDSSGPTRPPRPAVLMSRSSPTTPARPTAALRSASCSASAQPPAPSAQTAIRCARISRLIPAIWLWPPSTSAMRRLAIRCWPSATARAG
jgi:hypothetical protein